MRPTVVCAGLNESAAARRVFLPAVAAAARRPAVTGIPLFLIAHAEFLLL